MPFVVSIDDAQRQYPKYKFVSTLTPSEQKASFHVQNEQGQDLCLKIISPDYAIERLSREILALQSLSHPNVVKFVEYTYSVKPDGLQHFIVEEFIKGTDLTEILQINNWQTMQILRFFTEVLDGLSALDDKNIVHRDLKPSNIRVRRK